MAVDPEGYSLIHVIKIFFELEVQLSLISEKNYFIHFQIGCGLKVENKYKYTIQTKDGMAVAQWRQMPHF